MDERLWLILASSRANCLRSHTANSANPDDVCLSWDHCTKHGAPHLAETKAEELTSARRHAGRNAGNVCFDCVSVMTADPSLCAHLQKVRNPRRQVLLQRQVIVDVLVLVVGHVDLWSRCLLSRPLLRRGLELTKERRGKTACHLGEGLRSFSRLGSCCLGTSQNNDRHQKRTHACQKKIKKSHQKHNSRPDTGHRVFQKRNEVQII